MKLFKSILPIAAAFLFVSCLPVQAQQPPGNPPGGPGGGRGGRGGPQLPPEQQAEVDRIISALDAETKAVTTANSNLVAAAFSTPVNQTNITEANERLSRARAAWAAKAAQLLAATKASDKKLSPEAIARLAQMSRSRGSGRDGPPGFGGGGGRPPGPQP